MSQLICRPERNLPVAVLRVSGTLDLLTSDALRLAVARSLSCQPVTLLLDVGGLRVADPAGLDVLARATAEWPSVPIVLCNAGPDVTRALADRPGAGVVGTSTSCAEAIQEAGDEPEPRRVRVRLRPVPDACRQVRHLITQTCAAWQRTDVAATAALVATELVANVVRHAHTTMEFTLGLRNGRICLAVRDGSRSLPRPADPAFTDAGGRGLHLVRELSETWGVLPVADGKVVWTMLPAS